MRSHGTSEGRQDTDGLEPGMPELLHAGAIPFRRGEHDWEVLLVTSKKGNWIFPKGLVEYGDSVEDTALRECREEAGVEGRLLPRAIGTYADRKWRRPCKVHMFLLEYDSDVPWDESDLRRRRWCSFDVALEQLSKPELRNLLTRSRQRLETLEAGEQER